VIEDWTTGIELALIIAAAGAIFGKVTYWLYRVVNRIEKNFELIDKELRPNGGSSLRDAINRIETRQLSIEQTLHEKGIIE